jgi:hypothetical protein
MHRVAIRRGTAFGSWVGEYSVAAVQRDLGRMNHPVTRNAIYEWVAGRAAPRGYHILALVAVSRGRLTEHDILAHQRQVTKPAHGLGPKPYTSC